MVPFNDSHQANGIINEITNAENPVNKKKIFLSMCKFWHNKTPPIDQLQMI